jgi:ligand-binding sensor domain-containing protein/signal transduction histidine kinase
VTKLSIFGPAIWVLAEWVVIGCTVPVHALDPKKTVSQYIYDHWGANNGFPGGAIYAISQSDDGYLWIGTERGLVRFDGTSFTLLQRPIPNSPPIGPIVGLLDDGKGNLWIRPESAGLLIYRDGKFKDAMAHSASYPLALTALSDDTEGGLILSSLSNNLLRFSHGEFNQILDRAEVPKFIISVAETRDHRVWMGTRNNGLFYVDQGRASLASSILQNTKINALLPVTSEGLWSAGLWVGTDHGMFYWDGGKLAKRALPASFENAEVLTAIRDRDSNIWIGTNSGLIRISPSGVVALDQVDGHAGNAVTALYEDRYGDIWSAGADGVQRIRDGTFTTFSKEQGLPSTQNGPVFADSSGRIWFGPLSGGLYWMKEGHTGRIASAGLDHEVVYSIDGKNGEIWIGRQHGGLSVLREEHGAFTVHTYNQADGLVEGTVVSVLRRRTGAIWAGTARSGVSVLTDGSFQNYSTANGMSSNSVHSIAEAADGTIWVATANGLDSFTNGHWFVRTESDGLPLSNVTALFEDSKHVLWVATSGGLAYIENGRIEIPHNLPEQLHEQILGITEDWLGSLWLSTSGHLLQVNRDALLSDKLDDFTLHDYSALDGLQTSEGVRRDRSMVTDAVGRVWVSLNRGLAFAEPQAALRYSNPVTVQIDSMMANGVWVDLHGVPRLPPGLKDVAIAWSGSNISTPDRVRFRYKLDSGSNGWSDIVASRQVIYTNLIPGAYHFRVLASDQAGLWNGPEASISFVIEPAFWQTWWFRASCATAFFLAVYAMYFFRMRQIAAQYELRLEERVNERARIARELHDTLLQSFHGLLLRFQAVRNLLPRRTDQAIEVLDSAIVKAEQAITEGRNAIQGLRPAYQEERDFATQLRAAGETMVAAHIGPGDGPSFRVFVEGEPHPLSPNFQDELYRIGRELLHNAFKHSCARQIEAEIHYDDHFLRLRVRDDGKGIDPQVLKEGKYPGHWGLPGVLERAQMVNAKVDFWTEAGAGSEVQVCAPAASAYAAAFRTPKVRLGRKKVR